MATAAAEWWAGSSKVGSLLSRRQITARQRCRDPMLHLGPARARVHASANETAAVSRARGPSRLETVSVATPSAKELALAVGRTTGPNRSDDWSQAHLADLVSSTNEGGRDDLTIRARSVLKPQHPFDRRSEC